MTGKRVRIGSGSAYWGDIVEPAVELAEKGDVQYISFDSLAELTMSVFQRAKMRDPSKGYIPDVLAILRRVLPAAARNGITLIFNGGAANPESCGTAVRELCMEMGLSGLRVATVVGDDVLDALDGLDAGGQLVNLDTGEVGVAGIRDRIVAAHAYIGSEGILDALQGGADIVLTGRVADSSLYVAPIMHEMGWSFDDPDWNRIGAAVTLAHIVECSACCTGGMSNMWADVPEPWHIGFPILEVTDRPEGVVGVISKVPGSGGLINEWTIKEHLLYEVHDPANYLMPDGVADFTTLTLTEVGPDAVRIEGMTGKPRPATLKTQVGYRDGWIAEGIAVFSWPDALGKAERAKEFLTYRYRDMAIEPEAIEMTYLGRDSLHGATVAGPLESDPAEVCLRVAARTLTRSDADAVRREITHLWTLGGVGTAFGAPLPLREVIGLWPTLVPRETVHISCSMVGELADAAR